MNPHAAPRTSLPAMVGSAWTHRQLVLALIQREVVGRYRGSMMGLLWSMLNPLLMLLVYTFVFSVVFKARWPSNSGADQPGQFAAALFVGLIVHGIFAEVVNKAPGLVLANVNYVKRVVFPLEILPIVAMGSALFHAAVSAVVLVVGLLLLRGSISSTALLFPLVLLPLTLMTMGFAWGLASLGVFLRDVGQIVGTFTAVLLYLSPVFFPISAVPAFLQPWMHLNPLTFVIEQARAVLIFGQPLHWAGWAMYSLASVVVAWLGYAFFQKTRNGFADVL
ncbi:MAG: ABC transporter permease [Pseudomonadota bacterium]